MLTQKTLCGYLYSRLTMLTCCVILLACCFVSSATSLQNQHTPSRHHNNEPDSINQKDLTSRSLLENRMLDLSDDTDAHESTSGKATTQALLQAETIGGSANNSKTTEASTSSKNNGQLQKHLSKFHPSEYKTTGNYTLSRSDMIGTNLSRMRGTVKTSNSNKSVSRTLSNQFSVSTKDGDIVNKSISEITTDTSAAAQPMNITENIKAKTKSYKNTSEMNKSNSAPQDFLQSGKQIMKTNAKHNVTTIGPTLQPFTTVPGNTTEHFFENDLSKLVNDPNDVKDDDYSYDAEHAEYVHNYMNRHMRNQSSNATVNSRGNTAAFQTLHGNETSSTFQSSHQFHKNETATINTTPSGDHLSVNMSNTKASSNNASVPQHHEGGTNLTNSLTSLPTTTTRHNITTTLPSHQVTSSKPVTPLKPVTSSIISGSSSPVKNQGATSSTPFRHSSAGISSTSQAIHIGLILALVLGILGVVLVSVVIVKSMVDDMRKRDYTNIDDMFEF